MFFPRFRHSHRNHNRFWKSLLCKIEMLINNLAFFAFIGCIDTAVLRIMIFLKFEYFWSLNFFSSVKNVLFNFSLVIFLRSFLQRSTRFWTSDRDNFCALLIFLNSLSFRSSHTIPLTLITETSSLFEINVGVECDPESSS